MPSWIVRHKGQAGMAAMRGEGVADGGCLSYTRKTCPSCQQGLVRTFMVLSTYGAMPIRTFANEA